MSKPEWDERGILSGSVAEVGDGYIRRINQISKYIKNNGRQVIAVRKVSKKYGKGKNKMELKVLA